jgi:hypothetical protein
MIDGVGDILDDLKLKIENENERWWRVRRRS